jgi:DnaJ-class molecular chaperone
MTHYATLGVTETANADEIKRAYRGLASKHHPDKGGNTQQFQEIQAAYAVLEDPNRRAQYDQERRNPGGFRFNVNGNDFDQMPPGMEDILKNFGFPGGAFGQGSPFGQRHPRKNKDLRVELHIPLVEALQEQKKTLSVQTTTGHRETVEVTVPRGIHHGAQIKYSGLGDNMFNTLPRGDLYVVFNVTPDPRFRIDGVDLISQVSINCLDAITGGATEITGLDGRVFELQIPAGTQPGTMMRVRDQGLYQLGQAVRGNLLVEITVSIPQNLTSQQLDLIQQIQLNQ